MIYSKDSYILRRWHENDWQAFKQIRLEALQLEVSVFGSNYAREVAFTDDTWQQRLSNPQAAFFGLYTGEAIIGLTGIIATESDSTQAVMIASYIRASHRGQGLSDLLYQARIEWAAQQGFRSILVSHREGNDASRAANQRHGFVYSHTELLEWPDGTTAPSRYYRLALSTDK